MGNYLICFPLMDKNQPEMKRPTDQTHKHYLPASSQNFASKNLYQFAISI